MLFLSKKSRVWKRGSLLSTMITMAVLLISQLGISSSASATTSDPHYQWKPIAIVSKDALAAGFQPGGEGGQWIRSIKWSPVDANFLLMTNDVGGTYRSLDGGKFWQVAMVGWYDRGGTTFAFDPHNSKRVLGVGGNGTDFDAGNKAGGVYLSTDKAASWKQVLPQSVGPDYRNSIAYDPSSYDPKLGYTTVAYYVSRDSGIYKTIDGGSTWSQINTSFGGMDLAINPIRGYLYLGSNQNPGYGFYKSTDGGITFTNKAPNYTYGLAVSASAPDNVWISRYDGVLVSTDDGETFTNVGTTGLTCCNQPFQTVTVSPLNPNYLAVWADLGNYNWVRYYTTDGGKTWGASDYGHYNDNFRQTKYQLMPYNVRNGLWAYSPVDPKVVISNGGDWLTKSTDGGANYTYYGNGYNAIFVANFNFNPNNTNNVLMASKDYNSYHSNDGGKTWNYDQTGFDFGGYGWGGFALDQNVMWLGNDLRYDAGGPAILEETTDGGKTWFYPQYNAQNISLADSGRKWDLISYSDPSNKNSDIGFIGSWRTIDHGKSWAPMVGVEDVYTSNPVGKRELYGKNGNDIVVSTDHGATWTTVATVPNGFRELAYDHFHNRFWIASATLVNGEEALLKYENGQLTTISNMPKDQYGTVRATAVAVDPGNPNIVYVGNSRNIWAATNSILRSTDGGQTWKNLTVETPLKTGHESGGPHEVWWIEVNPHTHEAWMSTNCFGLWKIAAPSPADF